MSKKELYELAKKGREDLYFLANEVLNYDKMRPKPHQELTDFLRDSKARTKLILMPRGSFKSTVVTVGYAIQKLIKNKNETILISSETQNNAVKYVSEIKMHFEGNQKFRGLYGDWVNKGNVWKAGELVIKPRDGGGKDPSLLAGSLEKGTLTGKHFDTIILDDVVSINNINSDEQIQKTIDHYKLLLSILNPGGEIIVVGTRWGFFELYSWLLDPDGPEFKQVEMFYRAAEDEEGNLLMPEVLSREFLEQQRLTQGSYIYSCQYLNRPASSDINVFKDKHINFYDESPTGLIYFMSVDPAVGLTANADFTGIIVNGVDYEGNWYIQEAIEEKLEPMALIDRIFGLFDQYKPMMTLAMEKFALEKMLKINLFKAMEERNFFVPIRDLETNTRVSKQARIRSLQPIFEQQKVYLKKEHSNLVHQLLHFPQIKHDDVLDALKSQVSIVFPSDVIPQKQQSGPKLTQNELRVWNDLKQFDKPRRNVHRSYDDY